MRLLKQTGGAAVAFIQRIAYRLMLKRQAALAEAHASGNEDGFSLTHYSSLSSGQVKLTAKSAKIGALVQGCFSPDVAVY